MGTEIERKFLVRGEAWRELATGTEFRQGYLPTDESCVVRVRVMGANAVLTVKGRNEGISRQEYEYPIPVADGEEMLSRLCRLPLVEKTRYVVDHDSRKWEIDEFKGENQGLIVAEVELNDESETVSLPEWIGREVSDDPRFFNVNLVVNPFSRWKETL